MDRISDNDLNELLVGRASQNVYDAAPIQKVGDDSDGRPLLYAMEHMKHGNFGSLLRKISEQGAQLKSVELWRVFYCLFRACAGLAYPGGFFQR